MAKLQRILNAIFVNVLCLVLVGAYFYSYIFHEQPCPLCLLQRMGMMGICVGLLMNLRFGIKMEYYGLCILSALVGRTVSLRQIALHVCPQFAAYGEPVFGFSLYVWAFLVYTCSIFAVAILLMFFGFSKHNVEKPIWGAWEKSAFVSTLVLVLANIVTTYVECGFTSCPD